MIVLILIFQRMCAVEKRSQCLYFKRMFSFNMCLKIFLVINGIMSKSFVLATS